MEPAQKTAALWSSGGDQLSFPPLAQDLDVDVVIVGGGITGITTASMLAQSGRRVAVLEAARVGYGTTGSSTGNLYATVGISLHALIQKWDVDTARQVVQSRAMAIDLIEQQVRDFKLDCNFARQPWALYALNASSENDKTLRDELTAAQVCGLNARLSADLPLPYPVHQALVISDQAQFHPLRYVRQLAAAIQSDRCMIHDGSPAIEIDEEFGIVKTPGHVVRAGHIVLATHTPKGISILHTELGPYREYALAAPLGDKSLPGGIFWSIETEPKSVRRVDIDGRPHVLLIGEAHKAGHIDADAAWVPLEEALRARFGIMNATHRWAAQQYRAADKLPFIGLSPGSPRVHLACGFAADGLVYGTLAASLISDQIAGRANPLLQLYSPRRFTPVKSGAQFVKENLGVASHLVKDYFQGPDAGAVSEIGRGVGRIVKVGGERVAVYRDDSGQAHGVSAACTHMKCIVHWNSAELSWDCPCHGSRFSHHGDVLEGPALAPLERRALPN